MFKSMNHVPVRLRKLRGVALSKLQLDEVLERTEVLSDGPETFSACLAQAREEFMEKHEAVENVWITKGNK